MQRTPITSLRVLLGTLLTLAACLAIASAPAAANTCDVYAAPHGSDSAAGTYEDPLRTAQRVVDSLSAGETGCLRAGDYTSERAYVVNFDRGGSAGNPVTLKSAPGETARLIGIVNVPRGSDNVTLSGLQIEGTGYSNTVKIYAADTTVENSEITNRWRGLSCMMLGSNTSAGPAVRPVIRQNVFHACGKPGGNTSTGARDHGIYSAHSYGATISENLFYDIATYTIQLYPNTQSATVTNNVIDGGGASVRGGVVFGSEDGTASNNNTVAHNIIAYAATHAVTTWWGDATGQGNVARDNCVWAAEEGEFGGSGFLRSGNLVANPRFVDRAGRDFRLAADSPCLQKVGYDTVAKLMNDASETPEPMDIEGPELIDSPVESEDTSQSKTAVGSSAATREKSRTSTSRRQARTAKAGTLRLRSSWRQARRARSSGIKLVVRSQRRGKRNIVRAAGRVSAGASRARVVVRIAVGKRWRVLATKRANARGIFRVRKALSPRLNREVQLQAILPGVARSAVLDL